MPEETKESIRQILAELHAHRVATMAPADLQINIDQRQQLVDTADRAKFIKPGDRVKSFILPEVDGGTLTLDDLLLQGPVVLIFFRYAGCPVCNLTLPYYQRQLFAELSALGASLVAISPQVPERLVEIKQRHQLGYSVASDLDNKLGREFGIVFEANEASRRHALAKGANLGEVVGTGTWELPMPAAIVIGQDGVVRYADIAPDWLLRTEAEPILAALHGLRAERAESKAEASLEPA